MSKKSQSNFKDNPPPSTPNTVHVQGLITDEQQAAITAADRAAVASVANERAAASGEENLFAEGELLKSAPLQLKVRKLRDDAQIPQYHSAGAACFDLHAIDPQNGQHDGLIAIAPGRAATFRTGLAFEVPEGYVMLVFSRSGHGFKHDVRLANCVGVVDSDYRGEVEIRLKNDGKDRFDVCTGDRVAQAMLLPVPRVDLVEAEELSDTERGANGQGSTGK